MSGEGDAVADAYDAWAATYEADHNVTRDLAGAVLRAAPLALGSHDVLELGCGTGRNTRWIAERARHVTALDFSPAMLDEARRRGVGDDVALIRHDVRQRWPMGDASVDVVIGTLVLEHVADLAPIHVEAARVLRPGGTLFLCELHPERQRRGGRAHFTDAATATTVHVPAFRHTIGDFVNGGIAAGLRLRHLGEWLEDGAPPEAPPRLLSVRFVRP